MLKTLSLKQRFILLGALPIFLCALILSAYIVFTQHQNKRQLANASLRQLTAVLQPGISKSLAAENIVQEAAPVVLNFPDFTHFSLVTDNRIVATNMGVKVDLPSFGWLQSQSVSTFESEDTHYIAVPYTYSDEHSANKLAWFIGGVDMRAFNAHFERKIWVFLALLCATGIVIYFSQKSLYALVFTPLKNITQELRFVVEHKVDHAVLKQQSKPFERLIEALNNLIYRQNSLKDDMQQNVAIATQELRETLETVEIQNIELDIARKNAIQNSRIKSEFLANTSHELRTPLNGILGFSSLLAKSPLSKEQKEYLDTISESATGLLATIEDILEFSKLETGDVELEHKQFGLPALVEQAVLDNADRSNAKGIRLISIIDPSVPKFCIGDGRRIGQVLHKLISNAIKFSNSGDVLVRVSQDADKEGQHLIRFVVEDHGVGMNESQQQHLFNPFTQADSSDTRKHGGTGLGLAIAKSLVTKMKGHIGVESQPNQGSTFWFTIPVEVTGQQETSEYLDLSNHNALLLGRDVARLELLSQVIHQSSLFLEVHKFSKQNTLAQQIALSSQETDLLILDCNHKGAPPAGLAEKLRSECAAVNCPILLLDASPSILTSLADIEHTNLSSPITSSRVLAIISNLLNVHEQQPAKTKIPNQQVITPDATSVLAVDDNPANLKLLAEFLKGLGVSVEKANSGIEALALTKKREFDLVLMDVQMPEMNGMETTERIRKQEKGRRTPIIALTAHIAPENKTQLLLSGMDDFMMKPVTEDDLRMLLQRWVLLSDQSDDNKQRVVNTRPVKQQSANLSEPNNIDKIFDLNESLALAKNMPSLASDMLNMLTEGFADTKDKIEQACKNKDFTALQEHIHRFHGGCCYVGVPKLRHISKSIEIAISQNQTDQIHKDITELFQQMDALQNWLADHDMDVLLGVEES